MNLHDINIACIIGAETDPLQGSGFPSTIVDAFSGSLFSNSNQLPVSWMVPRMKTTYNTEEAKFYHSIVC